MFVYFSHTLVFLFSKPQDLEGLVGSFREENYDLFALPTIVPMHPFGTVLFHDMVMLCKQPHTFQEKSMSSQVPLEDRVPGEIH